MGAASGPWVKGSGTLETGQDLNNGGHANGVRRPRNLLLSCMTEAQFRSIARSLVPLDMPVGMRLSEPQEALEYIYFPVAGMISVDALTERASQWRWV